MRVPVSPHTFRTRWIEPRVGLALAVGLTLLLGSFVSNAYAYRGGVIHVRGGAGYGYSRVARGSHWNGGPRRVRVFRYAPRVRVFAPIRHYHYYRPRVILGLGLGFGRPYYPPVVERRHYITRDDDRVTRDERARIRDDGNGRGGSAPYEEDFDVTNEPPAGCYYHDGYCNQDFATLDDYTEHLQHKRHSQTIDIIEKRTGDRLHTVEFVDGEWQPQLSE
jgi:hypothetical protein